MGIGVGLSISTGGTSEMNVVPGDTPENGMIGSQFFLSGEELSGDEFFNPSDYNPAYHTSDGIIAPSDYYPALSSDIADLICAPCTIVMEASFDELGLAKLQSDNAVYFVMEVSAALGVIDNNATINRTELGLANPTPPGTYKIAVTRTDGQLKASVNGGAVHTEAGDNLIPATGSIVLGVNGGTTIVREFTVYSDPVTDNAELQALSSL